MKNKCIKLVSLSLIVAITGCGQPEDPDELTGARDLVPPRAGIKVGSLYYVREKPTQELTKPAKLENLCIFNIDDPNINIETDQAAGESTERH